MIQKILPKSTSFQLYSKNNFIISIINLYIFLSNYYNIILISVKYRFPDLNHINHI